jgi:hypothetical protein
MAYIGRDTDKISNVEVLDNITFDGSSSYTLQKNSVNFTPSSANTLLVSIDGVVQAGNFTVSGSTIDFGTAVAGTSTCDFILHYGVGLITTPADGTVTTAKLADSSVSLAKLTATGTKDATTFLRGDNTFASAGLSGWSEDGANNNLLPASASAGIYLGVSSATAANLLDDYEEGTWTPAITGATGVTNLEGSYTKVGNLVTVWVHMLNGNIGGSPTYEMTGLPFTVDATRSTTSSVASYNTFGSNATSVLGLISITTTVIDFIYNVNNSAWLTQNIQTSANAYLSFSASYIAN